MNRIASPNQLTAEIQRLLAYSQTSKPSREKLATMAARRATELYSLIKKSAPERDLLAAAKTLHTELVRAASDAEISARWADRQKLSIGKYLMQLRKSVQY
jgi:hypothetical protein